MLPKLMVILPPWLVGSSKNGSCTQNSIYSTLACSKSVDVICLVIPAQLSLGFKACPFAAEGSKL